VIYLSYSEGWETEYKKLMFPPIKTQNFKSYFEFKQHSKVSLQFIETNDVDM
jgi:hypothetical protein